MQILFVLFFCHILHKTKPYLQVITTHESIWWQRTQHVAPALSVSQASGFFGRFSGSSELRSSDRLSSHSENQNIYTAEFATYISHIC